MSNLFQSIVIRIPHRRGYFDDFATPDGHCEFFVGGAGRDLFTFEEVKKALPSDCRLLTDPEMQELIKLGVIKAWKDTADRRTIWFWSSTEVDGQPFYFNGHQGHTQVSPEKTMTQKGVAMLRYIRKPRGRHEPIYRTS